MPARADLVSYLSIQMVLVAKYTEPDFIVFTRLWFPLFSLGCGKSYEAFINNVKWATFLPLAFVVIWNPLKFFWVS